MEITIQQAANVLNFSPSFVKGLLEKGELKSLLMGDVCAYKERSDLERQQAFQEYLRETHALGLDH